MNPEPIKYLDRQLYNAIIAGNTMLMEQLIANGANVNAWDQSVPSIPLIAHAIKCRNVEAVRILIDNGADLTGQCDRKFLIRDRRKPIQLAFDERDFGNDANTLKIIGLLLSKGPNINEVIFNGTHCLNHAASYGKIKLMQLLIDHGANIDHIDSNYGQTAMHHAVISGRLDVVQWLVSKGAPVNQSDNNEDTPLDLAVRTGAFEIAFFLMEHEALCQSTQNEGIHFLAKGNEYLSSLNSHSAPSQPISLI